MTRPRVLLLVTALALPLAGLEARELTLLGLADLRGRGTFRTVRKLADGSFVDLTAQGLRAGTDTVGDGTVETRSVFRPTIFWTDGRFRRATVSGVSFQVGGGMGTVERVNAGWGPGSSPQEVFELPTSSVAAGELTTMFQEIVDRGGDGTGTQGFMIKSPAPFASQGPFSVRFAVVVQDAVPWTITGDTTTIGLPPRRVVRFVSSRRGRATYSVNQAVRLDGVPIAAGHTYHFDLSPLQAGANAVLIRITDPGDASVQEFARSVDGP